MCQSEEDREKIISEIDAKLHECWRAVSPDYAYWVGEPSELRQFYEKMGFTFSQRQWNEFLAKNMDEEGLIKILAPQKRGSNDRS